MFVVSFFWTRFQTSEESLGLSILVVLPQKHVEVTDFSSWAEWHETCSSHYKISPVLLALVTAWACPWKFKQKISWCNLLWSLACKDVSLLFLLLHKRLLSALHACMRYDRILPATRMPQNLRWCWLVECLLNVVFMSCPIEITQPKACRSQLICLWLCCCMPLSSTCSSVPATAACVHFAMMSSDSLWDHPLKLERYRED